MKKSTVIGPIRLSWPQSIPRSRPLYVEPDQWPKHPDGWTLVVSRRMTSSDATHAVPEWLTTFCIGARRIETRGWDNGCYLGVWFEQPKDAMTFKLAWGG